MGFDWEMRSYPPRALWAFESIQSPDFCALCNGFSTLFLAHLITRRLRILCGDSRVSSPVLNPLESLAR